MKAVQAEVTATLKEKEKNTMKNISFWFILKHLRTRFMGSGTGVCLEWGPRVSSFGFQRKRDFLFSVKTPYVGPVRSLSVIPPSSSDWPTVFPQGLFFRYPRWLAALGICAIPVIPSSGLIFGFCSFHRHINMWFSHMSSCKYVRKRSTFSLFKTITSQSHNVQYLLINKNICHCSVDNKFISLFAYNWIIKMT